VITYEDARDETSDRFADVARLAKLCQRQRDSLKDWESLTFARAIEAAALASDQLISSAFEVLSLEVQKRAYGHERLLDPELQKRFDKVGDLLDSYVGAGSEKVAARRAFLREIGPYATAHRDDELDYDEGAKRLRDLKVPRAYGTTMVLRGLEGRERNMTVAAVSADISGKQLRHVSDALKDLCEELTKRVHQKDHFRAPSGRDDIRGVRTPADIASKIKSTSTTIKEGIARISDPWQKDPLTHVAEEARKRQAEIEARNASDPFILALAPTRSVTRELSPTTGLKRRRETSSPYETSPAGRRRIERGDRDDGHNGANARLSDGGKTGEASRGSARGGLRAVRTDIEPKYHDNGRQALVERPTSASSDADRARGVSAEPKASGRSTRSDRSGPDYSR